MSDHTRWLKPGDAGKSRKQVLEARHLIKRAVREYMHGAGFIEIDTPLLVRGTTPDAMIQSFGIDDRYLVTSTEYQIRRLEAGGFERFYTLTQNFRAGDTGPFRNPEFTMLETARVGGMIEEIEDDTEGLTLAAAKAVGIGSQLSYQGRIVDLSPPWRRLTVREAIEEAIGVPVDSFATEDLLKAALAAGIEVRDAVRQDQDFLFTLLMERAQELLGFDKPVFLRDWPSYMVSTAREKSPGIAERSELVIAGIEISDGFTSFTDHDRQVENFAQQQIRRDEAGTPRVGLDHAYLAMMKEGLPPDASMALGFDRLVMLLTDQATLRPVLSFAWDEL